MYEGIVVAFAYPSRKKLRMK